MAAILADRAEKQKKRTGFTQRMQRRGEEKKKKKKHKREGDYTD